VNFGFAFGMQPPKFVVYARTSYGVVMTLEEATRFRNGYFQAYPGVAQWHERVRRERPSVVRTASGRWWRVGSSWGALCKRLNGPIQGTAADGIKLAMRLLDERLPTYGARMILSIHDEILVEAPENTAEQVKLVMELTMIEAMQEFVPTVPIVVEIKVRRTWSEEDAVRK
jgi:DNA polymerase-1